VSVAALFRNRAKHLGEAQGLALWIAAACFV